MNGLIGEVSAATNEQSQGIEQVNTAVASMNQVTQSNAANSEEAAAAAEELSAQAKELNEMVAVLVAIVGGANSNSHGGTALSAHAAPSGAALERRGKGNAPSSATTRFAASKTVSPEQVIPLDDEDGLDDF